MSRLIGSESLVMLDRVASAPLVAYHCRLYRARLAYDDVERAAFVL